jgi:hypothetical protein
MNEITITLNSLSALNVLGLIEQRLAEIDKLAAEHPDLPMRDEQTVASYKAAKTAITNELFED